MVVACPWVELSDRPPRPVAAADAVMNSLVLFASTIFLRVVIRGFFLFRFGSLARDCGSSDTRGRSWLGGGHRLQTTRTSSWSSSVSRRCEGERAVDTSHAIVVVGALAVFMTA